MGTLDKIKAFLEDYMDIQLIENLISGKSSETLEGAEDAIAEIFASVDEHLEDGFQITDVAPMVGTAVNSLVELAEAYGDSGEAKKAFVVDAITALFMYIDRGPNGDLNRIDIPWVPESIERVIENHLVPLIADFLCETAVAALNQD